MAPNWLSGLPVLASDLGLPAAHPLLQLVAPVSLLPACPLPTPASLLGPHRGSGPQLWPSSLPATGCLSSLDGGTCQFLPCGRGGYVLLGLSPLRSPFSLRTQLRPWHKETGYLTGSHIADARLKEEQATCPNCRCEISKSLCCRNLAVEKAVSELPSECGFCLRQFPRSLLERHQKEECQDRVTQCKYKRIGCPWHGPFHELTVHEAACAHPTKTGNELMEILDEMDQSHRKEMQLYNSIFSLLSFEKIGYTVVSPKLVCASICHNCV
uniref:Cysteine and histidine rich 1 n=1 Tax=Ursus maritimus TaxID=29073 RepID=A0A452V055_URSMA